jgi:hypothetical protein
MGLNVGDTPDSFQTIYDLDVNYTASNGRVVLLAFVDGYDSTGKGLLTDLQTIYAAKGGPNLEFVGILYEYDDELAGMEYLTVEGEIQGTGVNFPLVNNGVWASSVAQNYSNGLGGSVLTPWVYIISKYNQIAYKTHLGDHTDIAAMYSAIDSQISTLLTGPTITSLSPSDSTTLNALDTITITFSEKVQRSDGSEVDETCFRLTGAGVGTLYNPNPNSAEIQTGDLTELNYEIETGDVTHLPGNGAIALDISRIVTTELHITDQVFYTPVPLVGNNGHDYYTVDYTAGTPDLTPPRVVGVVKNPHLG